MLGPKVQAVLAVMIVAALAISAEAARTLQARTAMGDSAHKLVMGASDVNHARQEHARVLLDGDSLHIERCDHACQAAGALAVADYTPQSATDSNFGRLRVESSPEVTDAMQLKAMGLLEGYLTAEPIYQHWVNMGWYLKQNTNHTDKVIRWLKVQRQWTESQIQQHAGTGDAFWDVQALIWEQLKGILEGYNLRQQEADTEQELKPLTLDNLQLLNSFGDMDDLLVMAEQPWFEESLQETEATKTLQQTTRNGNNVRLHPRWQQMTPGQARAHIAKSGHCSALIKVTSDLSDILIGHTTWWSYSSLLRVYKHYITHLHNPEIKAQKLSFSSYPGLVHSLDDYIVTSAGTIMVETSNDIYDLNLYRLSTNKGALSWQRARAACMLSSNGADFVQHIQRHNSGTYNNQYMLVDLNKFQPGNDLQAGLLTIVEMMPGGAISADTTQELERGYWPSYNIPYFTEVYNRTGYPYVQQALRQQGNAFEQVAEGLSYQIAPRAKIFRRDSGDVNSLSDIKRVLRSNGWTDGHNADPFSPTPWDAICARGDLDPENPDAFGCYDAKVTSYKLALNMQSYAVNGPAWDGDGSDNGHPAFNWRDWRAVSHVGMINKYDTVFELQSP